MRVPDEEKTLSERFRLFCDLADDPRNEQLVFILVWRTVSILFLRRQSLLSLRAGKKDHQASIHSFNRGPRVK